MHDDVAVPAKSDDLRLALRLAGIAANTALPFFGRSRHWSKADGTPVGEADMAVDAGLRRELSRLRPEDGILSEESESGTDGRERVWILDPIDGTAEFVSGAEGWGTNVALQVSGVVELGVFTRPLQAMTWWAERGLGAHRTAGASDTRLALTPRANLADCVASGWPEDDPSGVLDRVRARTRWVPPSMSLLPAMLQGEIDIVIGLRAGPWDFAPAVVLVEEAGGSFSDAQGGRSIYAGSGVFTNAAIRPAVDELLAKCR